MSCVCVPMYTFVCVVVSRFCFTVEVRDAGAVHDGQGAYGYKSTFMTASEGGWKTGVMADRDKIEFRLFNLVRSLI